jgi:Golgi nucleoside diphosphatase
VRYLSHICTEIKSSNSAGQVENWSNVIKINESQIKNHLGQMVCSTVEDALNDMLNVETDQLCNAKCYEHIKAGIDGRVGY